MNPPLLAPAPGVDLAACINAYGRPGSAPGVDKDNCDLGRYSKIIEMTRPAVVVECGTQTGHSAHWFLGRGVGRVITIDIDPDSRTAPAHRRITRLTGDSTDPDLAAAVRELVGADRCMVSLDSDHSRDHVIAEINLYAELVSVGCYLVVEDGIYHWVDDGYDGDPLQAITATLGQRDDFTRALDIEAMYPITGAPAGWWCRVR